MKSVLVALATAAVSSVGLGVVAVPSASAMDAYDPYVSKTEFHNVFRGTNMNRVHRLFDVKGKQTSFYGEGSYCSWRDLWDCAEQSREYRTRSRWGYVDVDFRRNPDGNWVLTDKYAYWG